jgi:hypothetical protein
MSVVPSHPNQLGPTEAHQAGVAQIQKIKSRDLNLLHLVVFLTTVHQNIYTPARYGQRVETI